MMTILPSTDRQEKTELDRRGGASRAWLLTPARSLAKALGEACLTNSYILNVSNQILPPHRYLTTEEGFFKASLWLTVRDQWAMLSLILWGQEATEKGGRERLDLEGRGGFQ